MSYNILNKLKRVHLLMPIFIFVFCFSSAHAQYFDLPVNRKHIRIPFRLIRNMIVIKLNINDKGPFNFVLDTGVGLMIITEPNLVDSINLKSKRIVKIAGLGEGDDAEAYITSALNVQIPGLISHDVNAAILKKDHFNLSNYAGIPIDGLLGYEFFDNLAIGIDFSDSTLNICRPADLHPFRKGNKIPITIEDRKPYLHATITLPNGKKSDNKLVIDIGAGHPVSIENMIEKNGLPKAYITANLGVGLNGPIDGYLSRIDEIQIGKYKVKNVLTSFPDNTKQQVKPTIPRDGNLGIGMLKKFRVIFDYPDNVMYLKPGELYKEPFEHDMSGLEYYSDGEDYKHVIISRVERGSPADEVGLEKGDEIVTINLTPASKMSLEDIDTIFKSKDGRSLLLEIFHDNKYDNVIITLKRRI
jgi:hypothetical protein